MGKKNYLQGTRRFFAEGPEDQCWEWQGALDTGGYGQYKLKGINERAHRIVYILYKGEIPEGMVLLHSCDNRKCVNPYHLTAGTQSENILDMYRKGRR